MSEKSRFQAPRVMKIVAVTVVFAGLAFFAARIGRAGRAQDVLLGEKDSSLPPIAARPAGAFGPSRRVDAAESARLVAELRSHWTQLFPCRAAFEIKVVHGAGADPEHAPSKRVDVEILDPKTWLVRTSAERPTAVGCSNDALFLISSWETSGRIATADRATAAPLFLEDDYLTPDAVFDYDEARKLLRLAYRGETGRTIQAVLIFDLETGLLQRLEANLAVAAPNGKSTPAAVTQTLVEYQKLDRLEIGEEFARAERSTKVEGPISQLGAGRLVAVGKSAK